MASSVGFCCPQGAELPGKVTAGGEQTAEPQGIEQEIGKVSTESRRAHCVEGGTAGSCT